MSLTYDLVVRQNYSFDKEKEDQKVFRQLEKELIKQETAQK